MTDEQIRQDLDTCSQLLFDNVDGLTYIDTVIYPYTTFDDRVMGFSRMKATCLPVAAQDMVDVTALNDAWNPPLLHLYSWANLNVLPDWMWNDAVDRRSSKAAGWSSSATASARRARRASAGAAAGVKFRWHYDHILSYGDRIWVLR